MKIKTGKQYLVDIQRKVLYRGDAAIERPEETEAVHILVHSEIGGGYVRGHVREVGGTRKGLLSEFVCPAAKLREVRR